MRNLGCFLALSLFGLVGCQQQEPAAAPLAPPPPTAAAPASPAPAATAEAPKEPPKAPELTGEQKAKLYQDCWAAFNAKDFAKFSACYAENASSQQVDSGMPPAVGKNEIIEKQAKTIATAFPDFTGEQQLTLINGNNIVSVNLIKGTHEGPLQSPQGEVAPTKKKVGFLMAHGVELGPDNKVQREWLVSDTTTMLGQLGLIAGVPHRKLQVTGATEKPVVVATNSDAEKANLALYKQGVEAFNKHDVPALMATFADDAVFSENAAPADRVGKKEIQKGFEELFKGFPDAKIDVKQSFAAGDYVFAFGTLTGKNTGAMPSMRLWKKTDKDINVHFVEIDKIQGGKVKQIGMFSDGLAFANQLGMNVPIKGVKPAPKAAAAKPAPAAPGKSSAANPVAAAPGKPPAPGAASAKSEVAPKGPAPAPAAPKQAQPAQPAKPATPAAPVAPAPAKPAAPATPAKPAEAPKK